MAISTKLQKLAGSFHLSKAVGAQSIRDLTYIEEKDNLTTFFKSAWDKWVTELQAENLSFFNNLIVPAQIDDGAGNMIPNPDYVLIDSRLPVGKKIANFGGDDFYVRLQSRPRAGSIDGEVLFVILRGVPYKMLDRNQASVTYWLLTKYIAIEHLTYLQASAPNTAQAEALADLETKQAADLTVYAADATASYNHYTGFSRPIPGGPNFGRL